MDWFIIPVCALLDVARAYSFKKEYTITKVPGKIDIVTKGGGWREYADWFISKLAISIYIAGLVTLLPEGVTQYSLLSFALVTAGLWLMFGHHIGTGFMALHGQAYWNGKPQRGIPWIDWLVEKTTSYHFPEDITSIARGKKYGVLWMSYRWAVYSIPLGIILTFLLSPIGLLLPPVMLLTGIYYWINGKYKMPFMAQILTGTTYGSVFCIIIG